MKKKKKKNEDNKDKKDKKNKKKHTLGRGPEGPTPSAGARTRGP